MDFESKMQEIQGFLCLVRTNVDQSGSPHFFLNRFDVAICGNISGLQEITIRRN